MTEQDKDTEGCLTWLPQPVQKGDMSIALRINLHLIYISSMSFMDKEVTGVTVRTRMRARTHTYTRTHARTHTHRAPCESCFLASACTSF